MADGFTLDDRVRVGCAPGVVFTRAGDEAVLIDEGRGEVHIVNETAARIWELCATEPTFGELVEAMSGEYAVDEAELRPDLESFLARFEELGLIVGSPPS